MTKIINLPPVTENKNAPKVRAFVEKLYAEGLDISINSIGNAKTLPEAVLGFMGTIYCAGTLIELHNKDRDQRRQNKQT